MNSLMPYVGVHTNNKSMSISNSIDRVRTSNTAAYVFEYHTLEWYDMWQLTSEHCMCACWSAVFVPTWAHTHSQSRYISTLFLVAGRSQTATLCTKTIHYLLVSWLATSVWVCLCIVIIITRSVAAVARRFSLSSPSRCTRRCSTEGQKRQIHTPIEKQKCIREKCLRQYLFRTITNKINRIIYETQQRQMVYNYIVHAI